jgi:hypothetical protein
MKFLKAEKKFLKSKNNSKKKKPFYKILKILSKIKNLKIDLTLNKKKSKNKKLKMNSKKKSNFFKMKFSPIKIKLIRPLKKFKFCTK